MSSISPEELAVRFCDHFESGGSCNLFLKGPIDRHRLAIQKELERRDFIVTWSDDHSMVSWARPSEYVARKRLLDELEYYLFIFSHDISPVYLLGDQPTDAQLKGYQRAIADIHFPVSQEPADSYRDCRSEWEAFQAVLDRIFQENRAMNQKP